MTLREAKSDDPAHRVAEHVHRLVEERGKHVCEPGQRRRRQRRGRTVAWEIRDDQPPPREQPRQLGEVPGGSTEAVDEQQGRPLTALERPDPGAAALVEPLLEARQKNRRIRHVDRLFSDDYELDGDKAGRLMSPVLHREELET
jgi:hypothetical protein